MTPFRKKIRAKDSRKGKGTSCVICGKHSGISVTHHSPELSQLEKFFDMLHARGIDSALPYITFRLCPNHHAYVHQAHLGTPWDDAEWVNTKKIWERGKKAEHDVVTAVSLLVFRHWAFQWLREPDPDTGQMYDPYYAARELNHWAQGKPQYYPL